MIKAKIAQQLNIKTNENRSKERQDILSEEDQKKLEEIIAFFVYMEGASPEDIAEEFGIKLSTFKYKIKKMKDYGIKGLLDQRGTNGNYQEKKITEAIGQRIQELKIKDPSIGTREIAELIKQQDGTEVSHTIVSEYLQEVGLNGYTGSPFRDGLFSPAGEPIELGYSRYAGHMMLLYAAKELGCLDAAKVLDITEDGDKYSHERRYTANLLAIAAGKQRLSHMDELVEEEFKLACGGDYPKRSSNHQYLDDMAERDRELVQNGQESIIEKYKEETTKGYIRAGALEGENIYIDKHVIEVCTEKNIAKDKHGTKNTIVKAIDEIRAVCADTKASVHAKFQNAGQSMAKAISPFLKGIKAITGNTVKLLGLDKGFYDHVEMSKAAEENGTCIAIWAKDIPQTLESLGSVSMEKFEVYEEEEVKGSNGAIKKQTKTLIADAGEIVIDNKGHTARAVVLENVGSGRRVGILVYGENAGEHDKTEIADFIYGKQDVENYFKERKKLGSDKYCGGMFKEIAVLPPTEADVQKMEKRIKFIESKLPRLTEDIESYDCLLSDKKLSKKDWKKLSKKAYLDIAKLKEELEELKDKTELANRGLVPQQEPLHELDTRKMEVLSVIQDNVLMCRRYILSTVKQLINGVFIEKLGNSLGIAGQELADKAAKRLSNMNMQTLSTRLFEQGGYIYRNDITEEYIVIMKDYDSPLLQEVYQKLCDVYKNIDIHIDVDKKNYRLLFIDEDGFRGKYMHNLSVEVCAA